MHISKKSAFISAVSFVSLLGLSTLVTSQTRTQPTARINPTPDALVYGDRTSVYFLAANATVPRKLAKGNFPALSPDRKLVAYCTPIDATKSAPETVSVMLFDLATGKTSAVFTAHAWASQLHWSPNGDKILLTLAFLNGKRELTIIAPDGTHKQKVIGGGEQGVNDVFSPRWAPDGQSIFFQDMTSLIQVDLEGRVIGRTPLAEITEEKESITSADSFVFSPTEPKVLLYTRSVPGSKLFERTFGEPNTALFLNEGQNKKRLSAVNMLAMDPVWSRDGRFIYFTGYYDREGRAAYPFKIYRINRDGSGLIQITSGENPGV